MGEKSKWFRPGARLPEVQPILVESVLTQTQLDEFVAALKVLPKAYADCQYMFWSLVGLPAHTRLARNLKITIGLLRDGDGQLFNADELRVLGLLSRANLETAHKETAQAILNVYERYQLTQVLQPLFQRARLR